MSYDVSNVKENVDLLKDVLELNQVIIPKLISRSLYLHSITFPEIIKHLSDEKTLKIRNELKTFLDQSQYYLDSLEVSCQ
jgi:hypothetical protein